MGGMKSKWIAVCAIIAAAAVAGGVSIYMIGQAGNKAQPADSANLQGDSAAPAAESQGASESAQAPAPVAPPAGSVAEYGWLSVSGGQLVDQNGEPIQLRGVSSHGIYWYPQYGNSRSIETLRDAGANVFRIAMYSAGSGGYDEHPDESYLYTRCALENTLGAGLYAIVDWHVLSEKDPNVLADKAVAFFDNISSLYADEPGVLYEICNEPNGGASWEDVKNYANKVIPVIRKNAPNAVVLVGTPNYCTQITQAADSPLPYDNILYTYHYYADASGGYRDSLSYARSKGIGVFVTEWGVGNDGGSDDSKVQGLLDKSTGFLNFLDGEKISWVSWSLSNKDEGNSILKPDTAAWSGWKDSDLTSYGRFVFARLKSGGGA